MNIRETKEAIRALMKLDIVPFLWGSQGIGKTETVEAVGKDLGIKVLHLHLSTQEVGDLIGLQMRKEDGTTIHCRPAWFPTEGRGIIFLDEFNRAHPDVLQPMLPFVLSKTLHTHKLPDGWHIVAAGNYNSGEFNVTDTSDAALLSRFCHIDFQPSSEEFIAYLEDKGADQIADWLRADSSIVSREKHKSFDFGTIKPDNRRIFKMLFPIHEMDMEEGLKFQLMQGAVGTTAATSFSSFLKTKEEGLKLKEILENYSVVKEKVLLLSNNKKESRLDVIGKVADELLSKLVNNKGLLSTKEKYVENLKSFLLDIPLEVGMKIFEGMGKIKFDHRDSILNNPEFIKRVTNKYGA